MNSVSHSNMMYSRSSIFKNAFHVSLLIAFISDGIINIMCTPADNSIRFSAVTLTADPYQRHTYLEEWNQEPPSEMDPASRDASSRLQICDDITRSGAFMHYERYPVDTTELLSQQQLQSQQSSQILERRIHEYVNSSLELREVQITWYNVNLELVSVFKREYVFVCFVEYEAPTEKDSDEEESTNNEEDVSITPIYVSKLYNVSGGLHAHRFIFLKNRGEHDVLLVEGSARVYVRPDFNVELHYLELRKHHYPVSSCRLDPVCKLNKGSLEENQLFRLCAVVLTSDHFKKTVEYPLRVNNHNEWVRKEVSLKTAEGAERVRAKRFRYYELMLRCRASMTNGEVETFYISRAYNPHEVFVYTRDPLDNKLYLENLSTNVSIVQEPYNFGNVEI